MTSLRREHGFEALRVEGTVPARLRGTLYRVGPGRFEAPGDPEGRRYGHAFEADGAICAVRFEDGTAWGSHRLVQSRELVEERRAGRPLYGSVAPWHRRLLNGLRMRAKNAANTNLMHHDGRLFALYEVSRPTQIDPNSLETRGERDLGGALRGSTFSAHPHRVAARQAQYNFGIRYGARCALELFELPDRAGARHLASLPLEEPVMLHDFVATERHLVFFVSPAIIRRARALLGLNPFAELVGWEPGRGSEVIVVPIDAPEAPCRFRVDAFYQWHFAGAFDVEDGVVVDAVTYPDLATLEALSGGVDGLEGGVLTRHRIDLRRQHLSREPLDDRPVEFPQLDPRHAGGAYRRLWLVGSDQLLQLDLSGDGAGAARRHPVSPALHASEPIFVPRSPDAEEGDGWVLTLVYDERSDTSHVAILDTRRFEDEPVARVWFDHHIPLTFHGLWQPARA